MTQLSQRQAACEVRDPEFTVDPSASPEDRVAEFVTGFRLAAAPVEAHEMAVQIVRTVVGTAVAGAREDGIPELRALLVRQGGSGEARSFVYGDPLPAHSVALLNGTMARALDYCDTMVPGLHLGSSVVPVALTAAELVGGCSGEEFLTAVVAGLEAGAHLNLTESQYGGFDPTGVAGLFGATAAAARIVGLTAAQTRDALGLAFNPLSGTIQANADASLAVRFIQGFTAANAIQCVQLAQLGITGPARFLTGKFGYARLFGRDEVTGESLVDGLGERWEILGTFFKRYPCCGLAQGPTESALAMKDCEGIAVDDVERIDLHLPPFAHSLIGNPFRPGSNPKVNAQFSAQYCITNAFVRGSSKLAHFEPESVFELSDHPLIQRIVPQHDPSITGHSASRFVLTTTDGRRLERALDVGPGYPGNPLSAADHAHGFRDCLAYAPYPLSEAQVSRLEEQLADLTAVDDIRGLVTAMISAQAPGGVA